jgi:hypothetical protein
MPEIPDPREVAALDAIIAFNLVGRTPDELSDEELLAQLDALPPLSTESKHLLDKIGAEPFRSGKSAAGAEASSSQTGQLAAMYRQGSDETLDPKLKAEIERKREEIRARLRAKRKDV